MKASDRSRYPEVFIIKGVLKIFLFFSIQLIYEKTIIIQKVY